MRSEPEDRVLVLAARAGDRGALVVLIGRHWQLLLALCRRMLGDPAQAEDAAQEAVLQAMLSLDRLRRPERFGPWLAGIGLNVCRRWLREARSHVVWSWDVLWGGTYAPEPPDQRPGPAELVEAAELGERVREAVADLPPGQRAAVLLFYLSGLTHAEVAAQLGIEVGAVKTRLHKARRTLHGKLAAIWKEERMAIPASTPAVEMRVTDVRRVPADGDVPRQYVVALEEVGGSRRLPIWVGEHEGAAIATELQGMQWPRPPTYAFVASLLQSVGAKLREVRIARLADRVYYAEAVVEGPRSTGSVDARPSDAISLALVAGAPIYAEVAVLAQAWQPTAALPFGFRDPFGPGTEGSAEIVAEIKAQSSTWPTAPKQPDP